MIIPTADGRNLSDNLEINQNIEEDYSVQAIENYHCKDQVDVIV